MKRKIISLILVAVMLMAIPFSLASCDKTDKLGKGACEYAETRDISGRNIKYVEICFEDYGRVIVLLDATTAPITVANFIKLVEEGFYDGLTMHRIIKDFMIQGGDPKGNGSGGSAETIKGEFAENGHKNDISHYAGVISMARSNDMDSASSQFFICNADSPHLDGDYAAFGFVIAGMDVVDSITEEGVKHTVNGVIYDKTKQPVITSIVKISKSEAMEYVK